MGRRSQRKGARAEREVAAILSDLLGVAVHRGARPYLPGFVARDVFGIPGVHVEVKRREALSLPSALRQAKQDAREHEVAIVAHRPNRAPWMVTVELADLPVLARHVAAIVSQSIGAGVGTGDGSDAVQRRTGGLTGPSSGSAGDTGNADMARTM